MKTLHTIYSTFAKHNMAKFLTVLTMLLIVGIGQAWAGEATLVFDNTSKRTVNTKTQQVWEENGIVFTYNKHEYTQDLADYSNPIRLYAKTSASIECTHGNITIIKVTCSSSSYATALKNSVGSEATASGSVVTITPTASSTTYSIASFTAQTRVNSITVAYQDAAPAYNITAVSNSESYGTVSLTNTTITATPKTGYRVSTSNPYEVTEGTATVVDNGNNTFTVTPESDCTVQINFEEKEKNIYIDNVQGYSTQTLYDTHIAPSLTDKAPATTGTCEQQHWHFMGWVTEENKENPTDANIKANTSVTANGTTYYAVWAKGGTTNTSKQYSFDITKSNFNTTSYAANNNEKTSTAKASDGSTMSVKWTSNQVMSQSDVMQWQKNTGYIYNSTDLGTINSVTVTSSAGSFTTYYGTSKQPTSNTTVGNGYFQINVGNATGKTSKVTVTFTQGTSTTTYSDYITSCITETPVTLHPNGGTISDSDWTLENGVYKLTTEDGSIALPTITRTGYTFGGWATSSGGSKVYDADDEITLDGTAVNLYAIWTPITYTITYELDGGTNHTSNPANYTIETATISLQNPSKTGYTFGGWYKESTFATQVTQIANGSTGNITLYAMWIVNTHTLTWNVNGGDALTGTYTSGTVEYGATITPPDFPTRNGYDFTYWYDGTNMVEHNNLLETMPDHDLTYTAQWEAVVYGISYQGLEGASNNANNPDTYTIESETITFLPPGERTGYKFTGWTPTSITKGSTGDITVTANWTAKALVNYRTTCLPIHEVTLNPDGGTISDVEWVYNSSIGYYTKKVIEGYDVSLPVATKAGYTNTGWKTDPTTNVVSNPYTVNGNVTLIAAYDCALASVGISGTYALTVGDVFQLKATAYDSNGNELECPANATYSWERYNSVDGVWEAITDDNSDGDNAKLTFNNCQIANCGTYSCHITYGDCGAWSQGYNVHCFHLKGNFEDDWNKEYAFNHTDEEGIATLSMDLLTGQTFEFKIYDGITQYGNGGTIETSVTGWTYGTDNQSNTIFKTGADGTYIFKLDFKRLINSENILVLDVTYPPANQAEGHTIYYDNLVHKWENVYYRIGHNRNNGDGTWGWNQNQKMTKVPGTSHLYTTKTPQFDNFEAWHIANNVSWADKNSIYLVNPDGTEYDITHATEYKKFVVVEDITLTPEATGSLNSTENCTYYPAAKQAGMKKHNAKIIASPTGGTITVSYTDHDGTAKSDFTSGDRDLAHTCLLTITATPEAGYSLGTLTVNNVPFTSGNVHTLSADAEIEVVWEKKIETALSWSAPTCTATIASPSNEFPTLTVTPETIRAGVQYSSSIPAVATIDATGRIVLKSAGTTTIRAYYEEDNTYASAEDTYELTVEESTNCRWEEVTIDDIEYGDEVVIAMQTEAGIYAMSINDDNTATPDATLITVSNLAADNGIGIDLTWYIEKDANGKLIIRPKKDITKNVYCNPSTDNNRVRVGNNHGNHETYKTFEIEGNYLKNSGVYYIGVYFSKNQWWGYVNNSNLPNQTLKFYKKVCLPEGHYRVTWMVNGQEYTDGNPTTIAVDGVIENIPTAPDDETLVDCEVNKFMGWSEDNIGSMPQQDAPTDLFTDIPTTAITENKTFYAVFAKVEGGGGTMGETTTVAVGDQVVIIQVDNNTTELTGFRSDKLITDNNNYGTYAAYSTTPSATLVWTVEEGASDGTFAFKNGNYYLNLGGNDNYLSCSTTKNTNSSWTITESNGRAVVTNVQYTSRKIMWNQSSPRFASYAKNHGLNTNQYYYHIKFYKLNGGTSYSDYITLCDNSKVWAKYDLNGGTGASACTQTLVTKDAPFNLCSETPTKDGYTFNGWSDGTKTYAAGAEVIISKTTTFYATWKANTITITWDLNYADSPEAATSEYVYDGDEIEMPADPTRTGYTFTGWYTTSTGGTEITEVGEENKPTSDVTYYAHWLELYTVTYLASGQVYVKQEYKYLSGDKLQLPENDPTAANFACDGYLFEGWSKYQQTKEDANRPELVDANTTIENDVELYAVWKKASAEGAGSQIFYESFDTENGTGGNDGKWSGDIAKNSKVNTTWTFENEGGAYQCIKLGSSSKKGSATTPALTQLSGDATLSFKAAAWNGNTESTILKLSISGGGTLTQTSVTLVKGAWTTYEVQIKDGTPSSKITFEAANASNNRFFLDEVIITTSGSYNYTTVPNCGPTMVAKENVWGTSANGQSVKVNVPIGVKMFEGKATVTGTSTNENFVVNTLENVGNGEHNVVVVYTPTAEDIKENTTITLTAKNGEEIWSTTTFTLHGRSLPAEFVVVANKGDKNYALPANMPEAGTYAGFEVQVNGDEVIAAPKSHLYNLCAVHSTRYGENGTAVRLVGNDNACLWASSAAKSTDIRNWAKTDNAKATNYEWSLYTEDGDTYRISSTAVTEEGRVLRYNGEKFGMYKEGTDVLRLLPVGCSSTPLNVQVSPARVSAIVSWTNAGACELVVKQGGVTIVTLPSATSPAVVSNLAESTAYTFTLIPNDDASCGVSGAFTTTGPSIDIVEWQMGGIRIQVDKDEDVNPIIIINGEEEHGDVGGQVATELFFSKYFEAHSENKLLAVYNGTTQTIDLNGYVIKHGSVEIDLSQYGQTKGSIASNEEIIFVSFDNDATKSAEPCAEKEEGFSSWNVLETTKLAFSGRGSVGLYKDDVLIDLIGSIYPSGELTKIGKAGKSDYCGTGDDVQLYVDGVSVNDQSSFFCHNGDNIKTPEVETDYPISTNRCLLIRKNSVTSGADAVASNKAVDGAKCGDLSSTFATLCSEWGGFRIGSGKSSDDEIQDATCEGLGYVGGFDYNNYYRTMETIYEGTKLDNYDKNPDDNTYFIEFDVSEYACLNIQLQLTDDNGNVLTDQITQVPILVYDKKTTTDELFSAIVKDGETPDYENSKIRCATCDVVILDGATLTKAAPETPNDVNQVRDIYVYPGGKLIIPEGATDYSVNSVSLRRNQDEVSMADIQTPLNIASSSKTPVYVDVRINSKNWHWLSLPYNCNIADVTWKNGSKALYNSDWFLMYYDGESRVNEQSHYENHWKLFEGTTIEAGKGYIVGITGHATKSGVQYELRFPMAAEVLTHEKKDKAVAVNAWGVNMDVTPNKKGWNLVGNPYLDYYQPSTGGFAGLPLIKYTSMDPVTGEWHYDNSGNVPFIVTPVDGGWYEYRQDLASEVDMKPFTSYFVQVGQPDTHEDDEELSASFTHSQRGRSSLIRRAPQEVNEVEEPIIVGVELTNSKGESDKTTLIIDDRFTSDYEMNADFFKWFGDYYKYYTKPVLYSVGADAGKRAFNALSEQLAAQPIPLGMFAAQAGDYTFTLTHKRCNLSSVEEVWLYDATTATYTNLMQQDYTFTTAKTEGEGRFYLSVKMKQKTPTAVENVNGNLSLVAHQQTLVLSGLPAEAQVWVYDATGKLLHSEHATAYQRIYPVQQAGVYFVSVKGQGDAQTLSTIVK